MQLISREWIITDADGDVETVQGPGVVGEQPVLDPGESFEYTSFCPLRTPIGSMHGTYQMVTPGGKPVRRHDRALLARRADRPQLRAVRPEPVAFEQELDLADLADVAAFRPLHVEDAAVADHAGPCGPRGP